MAWYYVDSISVANGASVVSVTGNVDLSQIKAGWMFYTGTTIAEVKSGTSPNGVGLSEITLEKPWEGVTASAQKGLIAPTSGALLEALKGLEETNAFAIATHKALSDIATLDADVTIKDSAGNEHTFASLPKNARIIQELVASVATLESDSSSEATGEFSAVIASTSGKATGSKSAVIASISNSEASGERSFVAASLDGVSSGDQAAVVGSGASEAKGNATGVLFSYGSFSAIETLYSAVFCSDGSEVSGDYSVVMASSAGNAKGSNSAVISSAVSESIGSRSNVLSSSDGHAVASNSGVMNSSTSWAKGARAVVLSSDEGTSSGVESLVMAAKKSVSSANNSVVVAGESISSGGVRGVGMASYIGAVTANDAVLMASRAVDTTTPYALAMGYHQSATTAHVNNQTIRLEANGGVGRFSGGTTTTGFDYAEYFENLNDEIIPAGTIVTLDGGKVRKAAEGEFVLGAVSKTYGVLGNSPDFCWHGRYLKDEWGGYLTEGVECINDEYETRVQDLGEYDRSVNTISITKTDVYQVQSKAVERWDEVGSIIETVEFILIDGVETPLDGFEVIDNKVTITEVKEYTVFTRQDKIENPDYEDKTYSNRGDRPNEYTIVGLLGQLYVTVYEDIDKPYVGADGFGCDNETPLKAMRMTTPFDAVKGYGVCFCLKR